MRARPVSPFSRDASAHLRSLVREKPPADANPIAVYRDVVGRYFITEMPRGVAVQAVTIGDNLKAEWLVPENAQEGRRLLFLHGGGYAAGSLNSHRALAARIAQASRVVALSLDYRLAPEHPFPAALSDALEAYVWILNNGPSGVSKASSIFISGDSAGGGLTLALLIRLAEIGRRPADGAVVMAAWTDLTLSGDSIDSKADPEIGATREAIAGLVHIYAPGGDYEDPLISPLFGAHAPLPPVLMHVSSSEFLFDDTWRFAERCARAGNTVVVRAHADMVHVWHGFAPRLPEATDAIAEIGAFVQTIADDVDQQRLAPLHIQTAATAPDRDGIPAESRRTIKRENIPSDWVPPEPRDLVSHKIGVIKTADGLSLRYRHFPHADRSAPTLLCLPGLTRNSKDFLAVAKRYQDSHHVICPDLRGRALSDFDLDYRHYSPDTYVSDVMTLLDHLAVAQTTILGTSLGGLMAMMVAKLQPKRVRRIILNDIGPDVASSGLARIINYVGLQPPVRSWHEAVEQARSAYETALPDLPDDEWLAFTARAYRMCEDGLIRPDMDPRIGRGIRKPSGVRVDPWDYFKSLIDIPTLVIHGALSDILDTAIIEKMRSVKPDLKCVTVPNRGHVPLLNEPECVTALDDCLRG